MSESKPDALPWSAVVVAFALISGSVLLDEAIVPARPTVDAKSPLDAPVGLNRVSGRLWEDPFSAAERDAEAAREAAEKGVTHRSSASSLRDVQEELHRQFQASSAADGAMRVRILPVLVRGGMWPVDVEARIRERQAVVSGLGSAGYTPQSDRLIGLLQTRWRVVAPGPGSDQIERLELLRASDGQDSGKELLCPFEWFVREHPDGSEQALVLWLDETFCGAHLCAALDQVVGGLFAGGQALARALQTGEIGIRVIGPSNSTSLQLLLRQAESRVANEGLEALSEARGASAGPWPERDELGQFVDELVTAIHGYLDLGLPADVDIEALQRLLLKHFERTRAEALFDTAGEFLLSLFLHDEALLDILQHQIGERIVDELDEDWAAKCVHRWRVDVYQALAGDEPPPLTVLEELPNLFQLLDGVLEVDDAFEAALAVRETLDYGRSNVREWLPWASRTLELELESMAGVDRDAVIASVRRSEDGSTVLDAESGEELNDADKLAAILASVEAFEVVAALEGATSPRVVLNEQRLTEAAGQLTSYIAADDSVSWPASFDLDQQVSQSVSQFPPAPETGDQKAWSDWLVDTADERRRALVATVQTFGNQEELTAQMLFAVARWERDLTSRMSKVVIEPLIFDLLLRMERNCMPCLPPALNRTRLIRSLTLAFIEAYTLGGLRAAHEELRPTLISTVLLQLDDECPGESKQHVKEIERVARAWEEKWFLGEGASKDSLTGSKEALARERSLRAIFSEDGRVIGSVLPYCQYVSPHATSGLDGAPISLTSTVLSDEITLEALCRELRRRGVDLSRSSSEVALLVEWDTVYGRALPEAFSEAARSTSEAASSSGTPERIAESGWSPIVRTYIRGLDGPPTDGEGDVEESGRSEGAGQIDYVRRLARQLEAGSGADLRAIGVLGSDVYDKLLILQALSERFPDVIFFTTDMDARYLDANQDRWTRNLVVASSHGLSLEEGLQGRILPFRGSYQVSTYLATKIALGGFPSPAHPNERAPDEAEPSSSPSDGKEQGVTSSGVGDEAVVRAKPADLEGPALDPWTPRLFEVARRGVVDLSEYDSAIHPSPCWMNLLTVDAWFRVLKSLARLGVILALGILLFMPFSARLRAYVFRDSERLGRSLIARVDRFVLAFALMVIGLAVMMVLDQHQRGEPLRWLSGVSVWPTIFVRSCGILVGVFLVMHVGHVLQASQRELAERFGLPALTPVRRQRVRWTRRSIAAIATYGGRMAEAPSGQRILGARVWVSYLRWGRRRYRIMRIAAGTLLVGGLGAALLLPLDVSLARSGLARTLDHATFAVFVGVTVCLTVVVIDATRLFERFVHALSRQASRWPAAARSGVRKTRTLEARSADDVIDVLISAERSRAVGQLVLYPFAMVSFMVVARNPYFDRWQWPVELLFFLALLCGAALASAAVLRRTCETARQNVLERLAAQAKRLSQRSTNGPARPQLERGLEQAREEVRTLRQGAYSSYLSGPIVRAALVPFSGFSFVAILDILAHFGF